MDMEYKSVPVDLKAIDEKGEGILRFIRFHQEDKDSDITLPGFVGQQEAVLLSGHNWKSDYPPLGHGASFEADGATNFRFQLNLADERAKAWHSWLKMGKNLQQVSYGFSPYADGQERGQKDGKSVRYLKPRPDGSPGAKLHEVSFVVVGSGNDTAVLNIKESVRVGEESPAYQRADGFPELPASTLPESNTLWHIVGVHHTGIDDSPFEASRYYKRLQPGQSAGFYRSAFALRWPGTTAEMKDSWGFLHHHIDDDGKPGAASVEACLVGISWLKGWDGLFVPEELREALHAHYAAHLHDGGYDVPDLLKRDSGITMEHELDFWLWRAKSVIDRKERITEMLIRKGDEQAKRIIEKFEQFCKHVAHMQMVAGTAGDAMTHLEEQQELSLRAQQITQELAEESRLEEEAKQAELQAIFERFRVNHG